MPLPSLFAVAVLILAAALVYATVSNADASAYLAAMARFGIDPGTMKLIVLASNIMVALLAFGQVPAGGLLRLAAVLVLC